MQKRQQSDETRLRFCRIPGKMSPLMRQRESASQRVIAAPDNRFQPIWIDKSSDAGSFKITVKEGCFRTRQSNVTASAELSQQSIIGWSKAALPFRIIRQRGLMCCFDF